MSKCIRIKGARQNNLKNIDIELPLNSITVVTGVSGSGKSSFAFDTVYAEGQRRYIESFSAYARQFMERMDKPGVKQIEGILPSIAIDQTNTIKTSRSTLGTLTEINDYMKLLFPRLATLQCSGCGKPVEKDTSETIAQKLLGQFATAACFITFPFPLTFSSNVTSREIEEGLRRQGFFRIYLNGVLQEISSGLLEDHSGGLVHILVDRPVIAPEQAKRLVDSLETAMKFGNGCTDVFFPDNGTPPLKFSSSLHCPHCDISYKTPSPNLFSFNSPIGACECCNGFGKTIEVDLNAVIPDPTRSLKNDAVKPWSTPSYREAYYDLLGFCKKNKISSTIPFSDLPREHKDAVINGNDDFYGVMGFFDWLGTKTYKIHIRVLLSKYRTYETCPDCCGTRFKKETLLYRIDGKSIADVYEMNINQCCTFFKGLQYGASEDKTVGVLLREIIRRLDYLDQVGLGYLTLSRQSRTLSGGEVERASLTTALGSSLVNTLYVLDEPSIGLHPRDTGRLMDIIKGLRNLGNTILIVEHDPDIILQSDKVIDLGPASGEQGGDVVFSGAPRDMTKSAASLTGQYISRAMTIPVPGKRRKPDPQARICINRASHNNLHMISTSVSLGVLVCITGVSGSGKSTLLEEVLYTYLSKNQQDTASPCYFEGTTAPQRVLLMDQSPIGKTPRSNPVTYIKAFADIRSLFAQTPLAKERGYSASMFSFNSKGGRCEQCKGDGFEKIEMQFLADLYVTCSACRGKRYSPEILDVCYKGKNIHDVLAMTISEGRTFFADIPKIGYPLKLLDMVGLGYLQLGQAANTLSGGESQRLKLASIIRAGGDQKALFLFDEPTTGLHFDDIKKLLLTFNFLISQGHSIIVVEHNMEIIKQADQIIDLGPEGGDDGGSIVVQGTPEHVIRAGASHTGGYLKKYLEARPEPSWQHAALTPRASGFNHKYIEIAGAREHNLKNISLNLPREKVVVITGLSGSGKSTLAFDILFAEGQRRFLETLSPYARQYITQMKRPEVDAIKGLPPTVAIEQLLSRGGKKSTVATATEIYHYLRLLLARVGKQHCPSCGKPLTMQTPRDIADDIFKTHGDEHIMLLAPLVRGRKGSHKDLIQKAKKDGYKKIRIDGRIVGLRNIFAVQRFHEHQMELVTDEMHPAEAGELRLREEVNRALGLGKGEMIIICPDAVEKFYSIKSCCTTCMVSVGELDPRFFSFNSKQGACPTCSGLGTLVEITPDALIIDEKKSISQGAIGPLASPLLSAGVKKRIIDQVQTQGNVPLDIPLKKISKARFRRLFYGNKTFAGLIKIFTSPSLQKKSGWEEYLQQFHVETPCPDCGGTRLNATARSVLLQGSSIAHLSAMTPDELIDFLAALDLDDKQRKIAEPILQELMPKLDLLKKAGLSYLRLDRSADTLSGGEAQRIRLAAQVASNVRGVAYVLDEPTIGLHPHDNKNLMTIIRELQQKGNSVIIVEHDEETIRHADFIVDLGRGGGILGGEVVASGTLSDLTQNSSSITGAYLSGDNHRNTRVRARGLENCSRISIQGAREHNLKSINTEFPVGRLTVVTGVSGSGKTTLVRETLYNGLKKIVGTYHGHVGAHDSLSGAESVKRVIEIDQSPIGKTPRSTPATYVGFYDEIRKLFALVPESRIRGYTASRFSFNVSGGRCEKCSGQGEIKIAMSFLPDMHIDCDVCRGSRFNDLTMQILFKEKNISQVLTMTVDEARDYFQSFPKIYKPLTILQDMGLGYLTLGQPSPTLSGGEAQRIKIAYELCKVDHGKTLYILDEPTTGLHAADIEKLMKVLQSLVDLGNTVIIIEHNLEVVRQADYIVDLGPGGGGLGGHVVAQGDPAMIISSQTNHSHTAAYLREYLTRYGLVSTLQ